MIILTIFSLILLYKMHDKDSKASYTIKTFGFLDLICSWGLIFFGYIIILLYTLPNGKENFVHGLFFKNSRNLFFIEPIGIVYVMEFLHNKVKNNLVNIIIK